MSTRLEACPPLRGNANGVYKIHIVGNSGSGKSTLGSSLAALLGVPYIALDGLYWKPGWATSTDEEFRQKIRQALDESPQGWIVDGNYTSKGAGFVSDESTDIIWLDPPLLLYFPRLVWRTFLRLLRLRVPCSSGCPERFSEVFFSKDSILWWCLTNHWPARKRIQGMASDPRFARKIRRLGGWGSELRQWWVDVVRMVGKKAKNS